VRDVDLFIVTHSLGSSLLLTTLADMSTNYDQSEAAKGLIKQTALVALLANQFPLFRYVRDPQGGIDRVFSSSEIRHPLWRFRIRTTC